MVHLFVRSISRPTDRASKVRLRQVFDMGKHAPVLVLEATCGGNVGRHTSVDKNIISPGIRRYWDGTQNKETPPRVEFAGEVG